MSLLLSQTFCFLSLTLSFLSLFQSAHSLSTVAISETGSLTLICASIHSSNRQNYLNCTSFPDRTQVPISFLNTSVSGLVAGNGFLCGLSSLTSPRPTSVLVCRRASNASHGNISYKRIYKGPLLKDLDAGNSHICGVVNETNRLECWQWRRFNSSVSKPWNFSSIAVGENFVCGLSKLGNIKCLTEQNNEVKSTVAGHEPAGNYSVISAGFHHACAISLNGNLDCWGDMAAAEKRRPDGYFTSLALGDGRSCAMRDNGTVVCWGVGDFSLPESLRATGFIAIEAKRRIFCGIVLSNYSLYCWGSETLDSNPMVFEKVVPGPCTPSCPCSRPLPNYDDFCSQGLMVCEPCASRPPGGSPPPQGTTSGGGGGGDWTKKNVAFLVVGCLGSTMSLLMICGYLFCKYCKVRGSRVHDSGPLDDQEANPPRQGGRSSNFEAPPPAAATGGPVLDKRLSHLASIGSGSHLQEFSLEVLHQATNTFSDEYKIGSGSFGSVYHAILDDGLEVAIKRAEASTTQFHLANTKRQEEDKDDAFVNELEALSRLNHKNLVRLFGYCEDNNERILVYEYMKNGTLHDHLHKLKSSPLMSWPNRIKAALDAARGIEYLHMYATPQIIHRDIKSSNILLDATWTAKVSDFGLSLMGPSDEESHLSLKAAGTLGYMDPEYYRLQQLTAKSDVYSFGVVLLELLSGYKAIHQNENGVPRNVVDFVVPYIVQDEIHRVLDRNVPPPTPFEIEGVAYVGYLAADCVMLGGRDRPTMTEIVNNLDRALAACLAAPWQSSPSTTGSPA
ncbi:serine/threonine-protein kinase-like protein CCR4 [Diospyros lotus]|uniref:serine/threonine-protein kinase-like protein CCR4 n=1 Tax=Diospyros lotus TaxID=55363 RepID=UPI00225BEFF1|nr:serine/threonine-protein kinase-like protein CCR4 [Diospyros lotus]